MIVALWLLAIQGLIGAFDTLYYHEWRARLPARGAQSARELKLHAARDFFYAVLFGTLPWLAWHGGWVLVLAGVLIAEIVLTLTDFVVEIAVRKPIGDVYAGERVTHAIMGILYGAMVAGLIRVMASGGPADRARLQPADVRSAALGSGVMAGGVSVSGLRDLYAAYELPQAVALGGIRRRRFHRVVFAAAGVYNIAWGLWSIVDPQWLFRLADMPPSNQPAVFACLGMVVGFYGILYFDVARVPERGWFLAAVGLTGRNGPLGCSADFDRRVASCGCPVPHQ